MTPKKDWGRPSQDLRQITLIAQADNEIGSG